ncbi:small ubiquitin-related modifier 1-like isoform X2 [Olea europaea var. sylvestris]|uniref:small ubiquitin-related modifier 1-like isoform X2 n=1 Tax=Olea europaea var. sylvestris TaxID=158386 RepID=UPI000C1D003D|nr:small ubiquitin-related modifier 1-like isoform X2 [Olea europaea var. sylvestris]
MSGATQDEDKKPGDQSIHINLKVKGQDGSEVVFRIKRSTQLKKLMNAYCDRQSVEFNSIAFLFDGRRLRGEQTPDEMHFLFDGSPFQGEQTPDEVTVPFLRWRKVTR